MKGIRRQTKRKGNKKGVRRINEKTTVAIGVLLISISFIVVLTPSAVWAAGSSLIWGNNDSLGKSPPTKQAQQAAAQGAMNSYSANNFFWWKANLYGSMTTRSEMLSDTYAQEQYYAWNTALYIGDSIFEAINYPGPPQNLWLYPNNYDSTYEKVWDYYISAMGTVYGTHYFVFMWSCGSANFIGAGTGSQGYPENPNGPWAMPYSWTKKNDLSSDGYGNPGGSAVFIGFQYWSKNLDEKDLNYQNGGTYSTFVQRFYYWAVQQHKSINDALNRAAQDISGNPFATLANLKLRTGYYDSQGNGLWCYIRVFGNGAMVIPY